MDNWFYNLNGKRIGPVTTVELQNLFRSGGVTEDTLIWSSVTGDDWQRYDQISQLKLENDGGPPPLPPAAISDRWAWIMALTPLLLAVFDVWIKETTGKELGIGPYWLILLIVCLTCVSMDIRLASDAGSGKKMAGVGAWILLSPVVYLFVRAKRLQKSLIPGFVCLAGVLLPAFLVTGPLTDSYYLGSGTPACSADSSIAQVKKIFLRLPANLASLEAVNVEEINDAGTTDNKRTCKAKVLASDGNKYGVIYTIEPKGDSYYYYLNVSG